MGDFNPDEDFMRKAMHAGEPAPLAAEPIIARAKRRRARRVQGVLVGCVAVVVVGFGALTAVIGSQSPQHSGTGPAAPRVRDASAPTLAEDAPVGLDGGFSLVRRGGQLCVQHEPQPETCQPLEASGRVFGHPFGGQRAAVAVADERATRFEAAVAGRRTGVRMWEVDGKAVRVVALVAPSADPVRVRGFDAAGAEVFTAEG